jgi:1-acyl-sn-glycerol-3-phosphate acyltransferase
MFVLKLPLVVFRGVIVLILTLLIHWFLIRIPQLVGRNKRRHPGAIGLWGKMLAFMMGVSVVRKNRRDWPMGDLIVANHMGFLDVPVLLAIFPAVFVIKIEMRRVFYFGKALADQGHLFVDRADKKSMRKTGIDLLNVMRDGDRIIVFPEGRASSGAERLPFKAGSFAAAKRVGKTVELCVIDYLPDRRQLEWDVKRSTFVQLVELFGRWRTRIQVEFFPSEPVVDAEEIANRYHDLAQARLEANDRAREGRADAAPDGAVP